MDQYNKTLYYKRNPIDVDIVIYKSELCWRAKATFIPLSEKNKITLDIILNGSGKSKAEKKILAEMNLRFFD